MNDIYVILKNLLCLLKYVYKSVASFRYNNMLYSKDEWKKIDPLLYIRKHRMPEKKFCEWYFGIYYYYVIFINILIYGNKKNNANYI